MICVYVGTKPGFTWIIPAVIVLQPSTVSDVLARNTTSVQKRRPVLMERGRLVEERRLFGNEST